MKRFSRPILFTAMTLSVLSTALSRPGAADDVYTSSDHGFRIRLPGKGWRFQEAPASGGAEFVLSILGPGTPGTIVGRVSVVREANANPKARQQSLLAYAEETPSITEARAINFDIAGRTWPGIRVAQEAPGQGVFRVQQVYVARDSLLYVLQFHAPLDEFESHQDAMNAMFERFELVDFSERVEARARLEKLASLCGSEANWASDWEEASRRARDEGRLVLVYMRRYPGFVMSDQVKASHFMNKEVLDLVEAWYVPFHYELHMEAPFKAQTGYGMGPSTFGNSFLVVDADGDVLAESYAALPEGAIHDFLVRSARLGEGTPDATPPAGTLEAAHWHFHRGELDAAMELLADDSSPEAALLEASVLRRQRMGKAALAALERIDFSSDQALLLESERERAEILLGLGRVDEASGIYESLIDRDDEVAAEAMHALAGIRFAQKRKADARELWMSIVEDHGSSRWSWLAAAALTSTMFDVDTDAEPYLGWKPEELFEAVVPPRSEPKPLSYASQAVDDVIDYLLETQRSDGSWPCASELAGNPNEPNYLTLAISAICGEALLMCKERDGVSNAVERTLEYVLETWTRIEEDPPVDLYMTYSVWSDAYTLSFLGACRQAEVGKSGKLVQAMKGIVADLSRRQKSGGGWSYYLTPDLGKASDPMDISMSFTTAAILLGLHRAHEAELGLEEKLIEDGLGCLERCLNDNHTFEYSLNHAAENAARGSGSPGGERGASGRGPIGALALHRFGRCDTDLIRATLDIFAEHRDGLAKERRKALMHCGVGGLGSHYVMFDYFNCAEAISVLPEDERAPYRDMLLEEILGARNQDGSYLDNLIIGSAFGAGAALRAFHHLGVTAPSNDPR